MADDDRAIAISLLDHAASDIQYLGRAELLGELGEGLARHGQADLAARAYVLAFTRSRGAGGWLAFGGPECHEWLIQALQLNEEVALATLAAEVAERAVGDSWGMTGHLIECFSAVGRGAEAAEMWRAARAVVAERLPLTSAFNAPGLQYLPAVTAALPLNDALVMLLIAFLNHPSLERKRTSTTTLAMVITQNPILLFAGIREAMRTDLLVSSVLRLLEAIDSYETKSFVLTRGLREELEALEVTDVLGFRVLARRLLERALGPRQLPPPPDPPDPAYDGGLQAEILISASRGRLEQVEELWPDFPELVDRSAALILRSPSVEGRMRRTIHAIRGSRDPARDQYIWYITDELFECVLQTHGSQVRAAVARTGRIAPQAEEELGLVLLDDIDVAVSSELSRAIRPPELRPSMLSDATLRRGTSRCWPLGWLVLRWPY